MEIQYLILMGLVSLTLLLLIYYTVVYILLTPCARSRTLPVIGPRIVQYTVRLEYIITRSLRRSFLAAQRTTLQSMLQVTGRRVVLTSEIAVG